MPHHLIDVTDAGPAVYGGRVQQTCPKALHEIAAREHLPIVTGGTGLYLRALTEGLFAGPERQEQLRARLQVHSAKARKRDGCTGCSRGSIRQRPSASTRTTRPS